MSVTHIKGLKLNPKEAAQLQGLLHASFMALANLCVAYHDHDNQQPLQAALVVATKIKEFEDQIQTIQGQPCKEVA